MKLRLDSARCTGHGRCYALAPELFDEDDEGRAILLAEEVLPQRRAEAQRAIDNCPEEAISSSGRGE